MEETKRLYGVLEIRLQGRDFLAGPGRGKLSIADFNVWPWIRSHAYAGIESLDQWPGLKVSDPQSVCRRDKSSSFMCIQKWFDTIAARPGVQAGVALKPPQ